MVDYVFKSLSEIVDWLQNGFFDRELGFTNDTPDDIEMNGGATGWYGMKIVDDFDGESLVVGYYGSGIVFSDGILDLESSIKMFFRSEFNREIRLGELICVSKSDWENNK